MMYQVIREQLGNVNHRKFFWVLTPRSGRLLTIIS
jgi:hypothetical protein